MPDSQRFIPIGRLPAGGNQVSVPTPGVPAPASQRFIPLGRQGGALMTSGGSPSSQGPGMPNLAFGGAGIAAQAGGLGARALDVPGLQNFFGGLGGAANLASGAARGNPLTAAGGAARLGGSLANAGGASTLGQGLNMLGGPISIGSGIHGLTQGNPSGIPSIVSGAGTLASGLGASLGSSGVGGLSGAGAAALAEGGAAGATAAMGPAAAGLAGLGAGLSTVGGIAALGPVFHSLFGKGGIFSTAKNLPTAQVDSFRAGRGGDAALGNVLGQATSLPQLTSILNTQFAPHGEVQLGSSGFGWGGDADDAASPEWKTALQTLRDPDQVATGLPWVESFVRNLWVQGPGQTGDVPFNPQRTFDMQRKVADALPTLPAYTRTKTILGTGGIRDQMLGAMQGLPESGPERDQAIDRFLPYLVPGLPGNRFPVAEWLNAQTGGLTHAIRLQRMLDEEQGKTAASYTPAGSP